MSDKHTVEIEIPLNLAKALIHLLFASNEGIVRFKSAYYTQDDGKGTLKLTFVKLDDGKEALAKWLDFQTNVKEEIAP